MFTPLTITLLNARSRIVLKNKEFNESVSLDKKSIDID